MSLPKERSKFRTTSNTRYLKGLFFEQTLADKSSVVYSLKDWDHEGFPSLYRLYMEMEDLTEYEFANKYLDGWEHWEMLCQCEWFKPFVERWRKELSLKIQAQALRAMRAEAMSSSKNAFAANKFLVDRGWVDKTEKSHGRGRPSKDEVKKAADAIAQHERRLDEDFTRLQ
jgi:hypothetical protein